MGQAFSSSTASACRGCFGNEEESKEKAKAHYNIEKEERKKLQESIPSTTETPDEAGEEAEITPSGGDIPTDDGPLGINSKTIELLAHLDPIGVGTIHSSEVHPILPPDDTSEPVPQSIDKQPSDEYSITKTATALRTESGRSSIKVIPDSEVVENAAELPQTATNAAEPPQTEENEEENVSISDMEKNVSSIRVKQLSEILDPVALRQVLAEQYAEEASEEEHDEEEDEDESEEMDPAELAEIERRKSESMSVKKRDSVPKFEAKLYRNDTMSKWAKNDIDALREDMEAQLGLLKKTSVAPEKQKQQTLSAPKSYKIKISGTEDDEPDNSELEMTEDEEEEEEEPKKKAQEHPENSHLFRNQSAYKWDQDALKQTKEAMEKEMMHLIMDSSK